MRKHNYSMSASQLTLTHSRHTYEVRYPLASGNVIIRCYSAGAALREWRWQQAQGRAATMKAVGT